MKEVNELSVIAKEWFDKTYGNSYFSCQITINGTDKIYLPFQYGYGDFYLEAAKRVLIDNGYTQFNVNEALCYFCRENNIYFFNTKYENCLQRDVKAFGKI